MNKFKTLSLAAILLSPLASFSDTCIDTSIYYFENDVLCYGTAGIIDPFGANWSFNTSPSYTFTATPPEGFTLDGWAIINYVHLVNNHTLYSLTNTNNKVEKIFDNSLNQYWTIKLTSEEFNVAGGADFLCACPYFSYLKYNLEYYGNTTGINGPWHGPQDILYTNSIQLASLDSDYIWKTTKKGYEIAGWSLATNGAAMFQLGQTITGKDLGVISTNRSNSVVNLYAIWQKREMQITLDAQEGEVNPGAIIARIDETYSLPTPTRWGHEFLGWFDKQTGGSEIKNGDKVERDDIEILYARWKELPKFDVEFIFFNENGEETRKTNSVPQGYDAQLPSVDETYWKGHTFVEWNPQPVNVTANLSCEAQYTTNAYTVVFDANGGRGKMEPMELLWGEEKALSENAFSRGTTGAWSFAGWSLVPDGEKEFADAEEVKNLTEEDGETIILYAVWSNNLSDLSTAADTEIALSGSSAEHVIVADDQYEKGETSVKLFATSESLTGVVHGSGTLTFNWRANIGMSGSTGGVGGQKSSKFRFKYIQDGEETEFKDYYPPASNWGAVGPIQISGEGKETTLKWYGENFTGTKAVWIDDIKWVSADEYIVAFDANGAEGEKMANELFFKGEWQALPVCSYSKTGYCFDGWALEALGEAEFADHETILDPFGETPAMEGTNTLYATWLANTYTLHFDSNGGSGEMDDMLLTYDSPTNLTACAFTLENGEFLGWSETKDGEVVYADSAEVSNLTSVKDETVTLYAKWKEKSSSEGGDGEGGDGEGGDGEGGDDNYSPSLFPSKESAIGEFSPYYVNVYNGWLSKDGKIAALVNVKTTATKTSAKAASATMTITPLSGKKSKIKFTLANDENPTTDEGIVFGALGLCGGYSDFTINAAKDFSKAKDSSEKALLNEIPKGAWSFVFDTGCGYASFSLSLSANAKVKFTGFLPDGTKVSASGLALLGEERVAVPLVNSKIGLGFVAWISGDGSLELTDIVPSAWEPVSAAKQSNLKDGEYSLDFETPSSRDYIEQLDGYPVSPSLEESLTVSKGKWSVAKSNGKIKLAKNLEPYVSHSGKKEPANLAALKLSYTSKTSTVKGSFKLFYVLGSKIKSDTVKVTGVVSGGKFYGSGAIKKQSPFSIKTK